MLVIIASYFYVIVTSFWHPFHVSVCEIYHNSKTNSLEISMKLFTDDLELSIQQKGHADFRGFVLSTGLFFSLYENL